jgi:hypothetical protein
MGTCYGDNGDDEKIMGDGQVNMMVMKDAKIKNMGGMGTLGRKKVIKEMLKGSGKEMLGYAKQHPKDVKNVEICFFASIMGIQKNTRDNEGVMHDKVDWETLFCFQLA